MAEPALINGRYRVVRRLGDGADGAVLLVADEQHRGALRALKVVAGMDPAQRRRLAGEFRRLAGLSHPRLVRVHDLEVVAPAQGDLGQEVELTPGTPFFTADYIEGRTPVAALAAARDRAGLILAVAEDIGSALAHVHAAGLVHCDVKPANIVVRGAETDAPEATLLDLGLSTARGITGQARGTLAYMAPEALAGALDPRADLYALGATLYHTAAGTPPLWADEPRALIRAICEADIPALDAPWLPAELAGLIMRLVSRDLDVRHSSAQVLLADVARVREALGLGDPDRPRAGAAPAALLPPRLLGREPAVAAIERALASRVDSAPDGPGVRLIRLHGPPGSGRAAIMTAAIRRRQLAVAAGRAAPLTFVRGTVAELARICHHDPDHAAEAVAEDDEDSDERADVATLRWVEGLLERAARLAPAALVVEDEVGDPLGQSRRRALLRLAQAGHPLLEAHPLLIMASVAPDPDEDGLAGDAVEDAAQDIDDGIIDIGVEPLSPARVHDVIESMVGRPVDPAWTRDVAGATGGLPGLVVEAVRAAAARAGLDRIESAAVADIMGETRGLAGLVVRRAALLPPRLAAALEALAVHDGAATPACLAATLDQPVAEIYAALAELDSMGLVDHGPGVTVARLPSAAHTRALHQAIPEARRKALHRAALAWWRTRPDAPEMSIARARHLMETGPHKQAAEACMHAARVLAGRGELARALVMSRAAAERAAGKATATAHLLRARLATAAGHYDEAVSAAERAARSRSPGVPPRARLLLARALQKRGDLDRAEAALRQLVDSAAQEGDAGLGPDQAEAARGAYARLLIARGRFEDAGQVAGAPEAEAPLAGPLPPGRCLRLESAGLARLYQGDADSADAAFARLEQAAGAGVIDQARLGRALALRGMVEHSRGHIGAAAERYARAGACARAAGDVHAAAVYDLNQATAHSERGRFGAALAALDQAVAELGRLGEVAELAAAQYNRGIALLALGEVASARRAARRALARARTPQMAIYAHLLDGDVHRRQGAPIQAIAAYDRARDMAGEHGGDRERLLSLLNLAEALAENNDRRATARLAEADALARSRDDRDRVMLARARVALRLGLGEDELPPGFADELDTMRRRARDQGRVDQAWRAEVVAARVCRMRGHTREAKRYCREARARFEAMVMDTPEPHRDGLRRDPDACALASLAAELGLRPGPGATLDSGPVADGRTSEQLRRLLTLSRRLNSQLSLEPLLSDVMDTAIEMTAAERGFLLLWQGDELAVVVARNFDQSTPGGQDAVVSRSMAERAARTGEVVMTVDAAFDDRFGAAESVAALRLRSVLAVPLRQKGRVIGTIYVDHRLRRSAFADESIELVQELADIAAVAIENARLIEEIRQRQDEIAALNRRLEAEVEEKEVELQRARLRSDAGGLRHEYEAIVGRSPAMLEMLRVVDRATDTQLPVLIFGESGTGKELIARALHHNGPRRQGPFVPMNCGAVPGELLESELFGHVRGAFTGAERDRRGLFEVADGGTLFLDEVADTSLAMQVKLLRVVQEGEIRRVGDARARQVDVRIIAASNRRLEDVVAEGGFREDLFYRLHVLRIDVPPLRERAQDIPALAEHILDRLAGDRDRPRLTEAALSRLCSYRWPGNVRELENQLARAMALAGEVIDAADLAPHVDAQAEAVSADLADLALKPQVEALERRLIEEALRQTGGNQSAAARLLGLSRYGLQKKLKRYGIAGLRR